MSPLMRKVEKAGIYGIKKKRVPNRIAGDDFFRDTEKLRMLYAQLIRCEERERVVLIPSVSYGMANVANNLPFKNGEILAVGEQFPSNVYLWKRLEDCGFTFKIIQAPDSKTRGQDWNAEILKSISDKTRVVAIGHVHWSDGTLFQLKEIRAALDQVGGLLIIDGTQSVGALPFHVTEIRPDALICAGYKWLMGPYSIGLGYYGAAFDNGVPIEENWINRENSREFSNLVNYEDAYRPKALRFEVGEHSNFILVPMLHTALKQVIKWKPESIQEYTKNLMHEAIKELCELGYQVEDEAFRSNHLFGIRLPKTVNGENLSHALKANKVSVSFRGDAIRVSPHVYNDEMDVRKLLNAMRTPIL